MDAWLHCKMPFYCTRPLKAISSTRKKGGQKLGFTWLGPSLATSENFGAMYVGRHENTLPSGRASFMSCKKNFRIRDGHRHEPSRRRSGGLRAACSWPLQDRARPLT